MAKEVVVTQQGLKALEDELKMPGWIVADLELVQLLDKDIMAKTNSRFIKASLKKDGTLSKQSSSLRTERELEMILSYVGKLLEVCRRGRKANLAERAAQL